MRVGVDYTGMWLLFTLAGMLGYGSSNVLDSMLVAHYDKRPWFLLWSQTMFSVAFIGLLAALFRFETTWALPLLVGGVFGYLADLFFFYVIDRVDISVVNAAWGMLAIVLSIGSFLLFGERWTVLQTVGSLAILGGVFLISYWHAHVSVSHTIGLFLILVFLVAPFALLQKAALLAGQPFMSVFFWSFLSRESLAFLGPFFVPSTRRAILRTVPALPLRFFSLCAVVTACFTAGVFLHVRAFAVGPLSLVAVVASTQSFVVLLLAWLFSVFFPRSAPRERLTARSVGIKILSFSIVLVGLALLAASP